MTIHQMALPVTLGSLVFNTYDDTTGLQSFCDITEGWLGTTRPTISPVQKPRDQGSWSGESYLSNRLISLSGLIIAASESSLAAAISALNMSHTLGSSLFSAYYAGSLRMCMVRMIGEPVITPLSRLSVEWASQLVADDPKQYSSVIPVDPISLGGSALVHNDGDAGAAIYFSLSGGVTAPIIAVGTIVFAMATAYVLPVGHTLEISTADHTVYETSATASTSRSAYIKTRNWPGLQPGDNQLLWAGLSPVGSPQLTVTTRSAWR